MVNEVYREFAEHPLTQFPHRILDAHIKKGWRIRDGGPGLTYFYEIVPHSMIPLAPYSLCFVGAFGW